MKKIISIFLVLTILLTISISVYGKTEEGEIIFSENFDGDLSRWVLSDSNSIGYKVGISCYTERLAKKPYYSTVLWFPYDFDPINFSSSSIRLVGPEFDVEEEEYYTFAVNKKGGTKVSLVFNDENGMSFEKNTVNADTTSKFTCASGIVQAPKGAKTANIWIETYLGSGTKGTCVDDIVVMKGMIGFPKDVEKREEMTHLHATDNSKTIMADKNVVFHETFEGKNRYDKTWTPINRNSDNVSIKSKIGLSGMEAMNVEDDQGSDSVGKQITVDGAIKGATYKLSFDAANVKGSPIEVMVELLDKNGITVAKTSVKNEKSSGVQSTEKYEGEVKVPFDAESMRVTVKSPSGTGINIVDNILITSDIKESIKEETKLEKIDKNGIVLFLGSSNALVNGEKRKIDKDNEKVVADTVNSRTLVPVRFIAENYGANVGWDEKEKKVTLDMTDKKVTIILDKNEIDISGRIITTDVPATTIEGRTMLPLRAFAEQVMDKKIFWDDRGLIVITDEEIFNPQTDESIIVELIEKVNK